jgi:hypothetical protein
VYRFTGNATVDSEIRDWSVILKVVGTRNNRSDPSEPRYWKREVLAYQSGQLANLAGELAAPRFFGTIEFADNKAA